MKREKGKWEEPKATCGRNKKKRGGEGAVCFSGAKVWADQKKKTFRPCTTQKILKTMGSNDESLV